MTSIQRNILEFLKDYQHMISNQAHEYETYGLVTSSERLKERANEIDNTLKIFAHVCDLESSPNYGLDFGPEFDRRKH